MITPTKLAWMAGVVDFKGRIVYRRNRERKNTPQISLTVQCQEFPILRALSEMTGTTPEMFEASPVSEIFRTGCQEHCPDKHVCQPRNGVMMPKTSRWTVSGGSMHVVLHSLMPYLMVDRGYKELIAEIKAATPLSGQGSAQVLSRCAVLMNLGWEIPDPYREVLMARLQAGLIEPVREKPDAAFARLKAKLAIMKSIEDGTFQGGSEELMAAFGEGAGDAD